MRTPPDRESYERELYERELRRENQVARANANASTGMLFGVILIAIFGVVAAFFLLNQRSEPQTPTVQPPDVNIEVPEPQAPEPPKVEAPDVNITVPEPQLPDTSGQLSPEAPVDGQAPVQPPAQSQ